ncbi:DsbC family protein [Silanimonas sp.]|uniref:DsbC family protein n=1 Tax=Silanimonas sp. TaxID=1929290 RepID=UPI001BBF4207|nr:DsbC family protein [Silanimonas sp.]MBS3896188.1 DsbC family protein [Silanimonas sp.]MBS3924055.1 DsbC family protein [Xanthomonadaceae bacterium]
MLRRLLLAFAFGTGLAACAQPTPPAPAAAAPAPGEAAVRATIAAALPGQSIRQLRPAPIAGFTEVVIAGRVLYVSNDGRYVFDGALIDFQTRRNLTEVAMDRLRVEGLRTIPTAERIVFAPRNPKHTVTVFTDISCGYCRLFHQKIAEYNALGIAVEYLFFPRAGEGSEAWAQAEAVWCARDPRQAMTDAKAGKPVPVRECENPVAREFALGREVGVSGTPAIYTAAGVHIGGYLEPARMLQALEALQRQAAAP